MRKTNINTNNNQQGYLFWSIQHHKSPVAAENERESFGSSTCCYICRYVESLDMKKEENEFFSCLFYSLLVYLNMF